MKTLDENLTLLMQSKIEINRDITKKFSLAGSKEYPDKYPNMTLKEEQEIIAMFGEDSYLEFRYGIPNARPHGIFCPNK